VTIVSRSQNSDQWKEASSASFTPSVLYARPRTRGIGWLEREMRSVSFDVECRVYPIVSLPDDLKSVEGGKKTNGSLLQLDMKEALVLDRPMVRVTLPHCDCFFLNERSRRSELSLPTMYGLCAGA